MADNARRTGAALEAHRRFLLWLIPTLEKFPRAQRFLLGDRIEVTALDVLERLIEATFSRERRGLLQQANLGLEKLRHLLRLAFEFMTRRLGGQAADPPGRPSWPPRGATGTGLRTHQRPLYRLGRAQRYPAINALSKRNRWVSLRLTHPTTAVIADVPAATLDVAEVSGDVAPPSRDVSAISIRSRNIRPSCDDIDNSLSARHGSMVQSDDSSVRQPPLDRRQAAQMPRQPREIPRRYRQMQRHSRPAVRQRGFDGSTSIRCEIPPAGNQVEWRGWP
jgi:hypothetical protein